MVITKSEQKLGNVSSVRNNNRLEFYMGDNSLHGDTRQCPCKPIYMENNVNAHVDLTYQTYAHISTW